MLKGQAYNQPIFTGTTKKTLRRVNKMAVLASL